MLSCSYAGDERDCEFSPSKGRWGTLWKRREERVVKTWHAPLHGPTYSLWAPHTPFHAISLNLDSKRPPFWLPPEIEITPSLAAARISSPAHPTGPHRGPPPSHLFFSSQDGGSEQRGQFLLPLCVPPPSPPPCRGSQENDLSCWGGGWGRSRGWSRAQCAHAHAHTHTLRQTAAARRPPSLPPHCGDTCLPYRPASALAVHPQTHPWTRDVSLPPKKSSLKKKEK